LSLSTTQLASLNVTNISFTWVLIKKTKTP
jgi:hypothetical protein